MKYLNILALMLILLSSCSEENNIMVVEQETTTTSILEEYNPERDIVQGSIFGTVLDQSENPISDATVRFNGSQYSTNESGNFIIQGGSLDRNGTYVTVSKSGFHQGSRRFYPQANSTNYVTIQILELSNIGEFEAISGGTVSGSDGIEITFPENSIQEQGSGILYTGSVTVAATWLDPTAPNINDIMPGDLVGVSADIEEVSLVSYGMMAVELFGDRGEKLNLAADNQATLSFPVPADLRSSAPQEIPLWSFDEVRVGIWVQEGTAQLVGDKYIGQVSHFSFWNCDAPFDLVEVRGQLVSSSGAPIANTKIIVQAEELNSARCGYTDNRGFFSGKFPRNLTWNFTVSGGTPDAECGFQSLTFGPFADTDSDGINLGVISVAALQIEEFAVTGVIVDCNDNPVTNGIASIAVGDNVQSILVEDDGEFELALLNCESFDIFSIRSTDLEGFEVGNTIEKPISPNVDCGRLPACGTPVCITDNMFVGVYMLTLEGASGTDYGIPYENQIVTISPEPGSNTLRSFQSEILPDVGPHGPFKTTFDVLCDRAIYQLMDTESVGCGLGAIMYGPALDENGEALSEPLDPNDDSRIVLFFNEGFADGGCVALQVETQTKMVLTKL